MYKRLKYEDFVEIGTIRILPEIEKEEYIKFHEKLWKEDYETCKELIDKSPRWSIISGYYAMHNLAKLFLAKKFRIKISGKFVHAATIEALRKYLKEKDTLERLEKGKEELALEEISDTIEYAKRERAKSQYYSKIRVQINKNQARYFFENIVKPFVESLK